MKRFTALLLSAVMVIALAACGNAPTPSPTTSLASLDELSEQAGCALIRPEGAEIADEQFNMIEGDPQIAEYSFTANGKACTLRFAAVGIDTDICGVCKEDGDTLFSGSDAETSAFQTDDVIAERWFTVDGQYVFIVNTADGWEWADFEALCSQFMDMEPKTWDSDVPFADYMALKGTYSTEDRMSMASVSVRYDHAFVGVYSYPDGENMIYWEMDAVLQDGNKLVYDKESISRRVVDESQGTAELVPEADGGAGYIEILPDGSLSFAGAYSAELQGLVLPRTA